MSGKKEKNKGNPTEEVNPKDQREAEIVNWHSQIENELAGLDEEFEQCVRTAEENQQNDETYAVLIQSWSRTVLSRIRLDQSKQSAYMIQRQWRASRVRKEYARMLEDQRIAEQNRLFYTKAVMIQKHWRGFHSRKTKFDFYKRKQYVSLVEEKAREMVAALNAEREAREREWEWQAAVEREEQFHRLSRDSHHLLSTASVSGVFKDATVKGVSLEKHIRAAFHNDGGY